MEKEADAVKMIADLKKGAKFEDLAKKNDKKKNIHFRRSNYSRFSLIVNIHFLVEFVLLPK